MTSVVERFWLNDPAEGLESALRSYATQYPGHCELLPLGFTFRGRAIHALRAGHGLLKVVVVAGLHSHEPFNAFGILAFIDSLLSGKNLDRQDLTAWSHNILENQTLYFLPLLNLDGASRFTRDVPNCWLIQRFGLEDMEEATAFVNEPLISLGLQRGSPGLNRLTETQMKYWTEEQRRPLGWLFSDQGVDLWEDWQKFDAPETRALRDFLERVRPECVFELHCHEKPSNMYVPIPSARGPAARLQMEYGEEMMTALREAGIPCSTHSVRTYEYKEHFQQFPDYAYLTHGCLVLFGEISSGYLPEPYRRQLSSEPLSRRDARLPSPSQEEIIRSVWVWLRSLVDLGGPRGYK